MDCVAIWGVILDLMHPRGSIVNATWCSNELSTDCHGYFCPDECGPGAALTIGDEANSTNQTMLCVRMQNREAQQWTSRTSRYCMNLYNLWILYVLLYVITCIYFIVGIGKEVLIFSQLVWCTSCVSEHGKHLQVRIDVTVEEAKQLQARGLRVKRFLNIIKIH